MKVKENTPFWFKECIKCQEDKEYANKSYKKFGEILKDRHGKRYL